MYYDYSKILSYNALLNFLIGERGVGKTYGAVKFVTKQFIKKDEQFAYIRRYKSDLKNSVPTFFNSIIENKEFPDNHLETKYGKFYIDGNVAGYSMTLSTAQDLKSANFNKVKTIIFDEFIIDEGQKKYYLHNEVEVFLNLIETIARMRNIRVLLLGNAGNLITNPYFLYFDLNIPYNTDIKTYKDGLILVQYMENKAYREAKANTRFGKLVAGTSYERYAIQNLDTHQNKNFIKKKLGTSRFQYSFIFNGIEYGVWYDYEEGLVFISNDFPKPSPYCFAFSVNDHTENTTLIKNSRKYTCWKTFIDAFQKGNMRFESQKIKAVCSDLIKKLIL